MGQLVGTQDKHRDFRTKTCLYIMKNKDHFLPFIGETDDEFRRFIQLLNKDGVFGGQEALVAISREHNVIIGIHQVGEPVWYIKPEDERKCKREIHLAYHQKTTKPTENKSVPNSRKNRRKNKKKPAPKVSTT